MWMSQAISVALFVTALVTVGIFFYLAGSFALMRPYAQARPLRASWRALCVEALWVIVTQPLLPLFYLFGHRLDRPWVMPGVLGVPIVLVHGYMHNRVGFLGLARALARRGRGPIFAINYPWFASIEANAARLSTFVADVLRRTGAAQVDLVCHSMGGLVAMEMIRDAAERSMTPVRRCVTIATPHGGVVWRGPILGVGGTSLRRGSELLGLHASLKVGIPVLSIYSSHDNVVFPKETSRLVARGGRDLEVEELGHLSILFSRDVANAVVSFLSEPEPELEPGRTAAERALAHVAEAADPADADESPAPHDEETIRR